MNNYDNILCEYLLDYQGGDLGKPNNKFTQSNASNINICKAYIQLQMRITKLQSFV